MQKTHPVKKVTNPFKSTTKVSTKTTTKVVTTPSKLSGGFRPQVRSRHPSHDRLRTMLPKLPFRSIVRFGSTTEVNDNFRRVEVNPTSSIKNSSNKLLMKECFKKASVKTADWFLLRQGTFINQQNNANTAVEELPYPIVAKKNFGSRGEGNTLIETLDDMKVFLKKNSTQETSFVFEKYYSYSKEYRLHITADGCFYTNRKRLKKETPEADRWYINDHNCVWFLEESPEFEKPSCWKSIIEESVKALKSVGLDVGAVDVRVQNETSAKGTKRKSVDFIIIEINSAPSFGEGTLTKYLNELPRVLKNKFVTNNEQV